jgi:hypothetical protein
MKSVKKKHKDLDLCFNWGKYEFFAESSYMKDESAQEVELPALLLHAPGT